MSRLVCSARSLCLQNPQEPEKTEFDLKLEKFDEANKIKIIKEIRSATNLPLKEVCGFHVVRDD